MRRRYRRHPGTIMRSRSRTLRHGRTAEDEADALAASAEALAVLLDAGIAPESAWRHVAQRSVDSRIRHIAAAVEAGATAEEALSAQAGRADSRTLRALAAAWSVAIRAGSPLGPALLGIAEALRDRAEVARDVEVALSGPRSTARLVGGLPLVGVALAVLMGVDVLGALTRGPAGLFLLSSGLALMVSGRAWTARMVRNATPRQDVPGTAEELIVIALGSGLALDRSWELVAEVCDRLGIELPADGAIDDVLDLAERAGAPAGSLLGAAAVHRRRSARAEGRREAARLGVRLLLPLGICVLPAFLLLGVAPVVVALVSSTLSGL